jgi:hypothetical protein
VVDLLGVDVLRQLQLRLLDDGQDPGGTKTECDSFTKGYGEMYLIL